MNIAIPLIDKFYKNIRYMEQPNFKVCVRCFTFNQSEYIVDAMNGFAMQKTDFPFVCCIVDDASTDGEQKIIKQYVDKYFDWSEKSVSYKKETNYAHILYAKHKTNKNCYFVVLLLKENHYSINKPRLPYLKEWCNDIVYIALCEGDDYWIDSQKLQKQVDYLHSHPKCRYIFTARYIDNEIKNIKIEQSYKKRVYNTHDILSGFNPGIQNVLLYSEDISKISQYRGINGDRLLPYLSSLKGEIHYIDDVTSVYRVTGKGVSTSIQQEQWFEHACRDFDRFHSILSYPDKTAYRKGLVRYISSFKKRYSFFMPVLRFLELFNILKSINNNIRIYDVIIIVWLYYYNKILNRLHLSDIKYKKIEL